MEYYIEYQLKSKHGGALQYLEGQDATFDGAEKLMIASRTICSECPLKENCRPSYDYTKFFFDKSGVRVYGNDITSEDCALLMNGVTTRQLRDVKLPGVYYKSSGFTFGDSNK